MSSKAKRRSKARRGRKAGQKAEQPQATPTQMAQAQMAQIETTQAATETARKQEQAHAEAKAKAQAAAHAQATAEAGRQPPKSAPPESVDNDHHEGSSTGYEELAASIKGDPILKTVSQPAFALIMLLTLLLFWRGHNLPGGGFVGGAMTVCALLLHRIATRTPATNFNFAALIPIGLATAFLTGLAPYLFSGYFLKSDFGYITTRLTSEFEWATAMLFDIGVFLLVIGGGMTIARELIDIDPQEKVERRGVTSHSDVADDALGGSLFDFRLTDDHSADTLKPPPHEPHAYAKGGQ